MSKPTQKMSDIGPVQNQQEGPSISQAQKDYDEGRGYVERGEAALAAVSLHNALRGFEEEDNKEGIANASNQLGHACLQRKDYDSALINYQRAWDMCQQLDDPLSLMSISRQLIVVYRGLKQYPEAIDTCLGLLEIYQSNNDPQGTVDVLDSMAEIYIDQGALERAADAYKTAASIHANFRHASIAKDYRDKAEKLMQQSSS